jgi:hypothetical protein
VNVNTDRICHQVDGGAVPVGLSGVGLIAPSRPKISSTIAEMRKNAGTIRSTRLRVKRRTDGRLVPSTNERRNGRAMRYPDSTKNVASARSKRPTTCLNQW